MGNFTEVSLTTDGEAAEVVAEFLRPFAYQNSVVLEQLGDPNNLDPLALQNEVTVKIYIPEDEDTPQLRQKVEEMLYHLNRLYPVPPPKFHNIPETDWANAWKDNYHPFQIGERVWIIPSWVDLEMHRAIRRPNSNSNIIEVILDPGMAFGTGTHPTTQKCILALERYLRNGDHVLDVGTGSGILAIVASKLGARKVVGIDTDPQAVNSAIANCRQNGEPQKISIFEGDLNVVTEKGWDIVIINILAPVIKNLLLYNDLMSYLDADGFLILSGIIDEQVPAVESALEAVGGRVVERKVIRDWVTLVARAN